MLEEERKDVAPVANAPPAVSINKLVGVRNEGQILQINDPAVEETKTKVVRVKPRRNFLAHSSCSLTYYTYQITRSLIYHSTQRTWQHEIRIASFPTRWTAAKLTYAGAFVDSYSMSNEKIPSKRCGGVCPYLFGADRRKGCRTQMCLFSFCCLVTANSNLCQN